MICLFWCLERILVIVGCKLDRTQAGEATTFVKPFWWLTINPESCYIDVENILESSFKVACVVKDIPESWYIDSVKNILRSSHKDACVAKDTPESWYTGVVEYILESSHIDVFVAKDIPGSWYTDFQNTLESLHIYMWVLPKIYMRYNILTFKICSSYRI